MKRTEPNLRLEIRMRKLLEAVLTALLVGVLPLPAWGHLSHGGPAKIVVGADRNYPPYEFVDEEGVITGFNIDMIRAVGEVMGFEAHLVAGPWSQIRKDFEEGRIDVLAGLFYSEQRDLTVDFSVPHMVVHHAVFAREDSSIKELEDLRGKEIVVERGDIMEEYVRSIGLTENVVAVHDQADALRLLASGKHHAALLARLQGQHFVRKLGLSNVTAVGAPILPREYCFAVAEGKSHLIADLNEGMSIVKMTGRYKKIRDKWFGAYEEGGNGQVTKVAAMVLVPVSVLLVAVWFWSWLLKRQVQQRTEEIRHELSLRKHAEEALRDSEARYRELVQNANSIIMRRTQDGTITFLNEYGREFFGYEEAEILGLNVVSTIVPPTDSAGRDLAGMIEDIGRSPELYSNNENENIRRNGERVWIAWTNRAIRDAEGRIREILCIGNDITQRKLAEVALLESRQKFKALFDFSPEAIFLETQDGRITECNIAAGKLTGYEKEELLRMSARELVSRETAQRLAELARGGLASGGYSCEASIQRKEGSIVPIHVTAKTVELMDERIVLVIVHDLTERRKLEEELLKAQKIESLGVLAGGIAHDFNNILTAILGNLSLSRVYAAEPARLLEKLEETENACFRARELTKQLLTFSKGGAPIRKVMSISGLIRESASFALRGSNVRCEFAIADSLWAVEVDEGQISQVINNLIINAQQAMPEGGTVEVTAENALPGEISSLTLLPGRYVKISFRDHGLGIPPELLSRIFDPYFTTKASGNGLGLATVYSIVKKHGGHVSVESTPGEGATFCLYLPASESGPAQSSPDQRVIVEGRGRILVMDDEEMVREALREMLSFLGYDAVCTKDGLEAIAAYEAAMGLACSFSVVIMDLTIPGGMGGREAIQHLLEMDPSVRAIVSSGYSNDPVMAEYRNYGFKGVISKPYKVEELSEVLHAVVSAAQLSKPEDPASRSEPSSEI